MSDERPKPTEEDLVNVVAADILSAYHRPGYTQSITGPTDHDLKVARYVIARVRHHDSRVSETSNGMKPNTGWTPESSLAEEFQDAIDRMSEEFFRERLSKALHRVLCDHNPSEGPYKYTVGGKNRYQRHADTLTKLVAKERRS